MIFGQDRQELRRMVIDAWHKSRSGQILSPLEAQIVSVVLVHPEYHAALQADAANTNPVAEGEQSNPFLHMGLHMAIREQVSTNRPAGIAAIHRDLSRKTGDPHAAEHQMIECLAECLWEAQNEQRPPDERKYLERLQQLEF